MQCRPISANRCTVTMRRAEQYSYCPNYHTWVIRTSPSNTGYSGSARHFDSLTQQASVQTPPAAYEKDIFYMRPKQLTLVDDDSPWYEGMPIGKKTLRTMLAEICERAGVQWKSNHGATEMFAASVPERLIQSRTGHRSLDALRLYERPSHEQQQAVSKILTSAEPQRLTNVQSSAPSSSGTVSLQMLNNHSTSRPFSLVVLPACKYQHCLAT